MDFFTKLPQIYLAILLFLILFFTYVWAAVAGADPTVVGTVAKLLEALFYALLGGFALGRGAQQGATTQIGVERAVMSGPINMSNEKDDNSKPKT